MLQVAFVDPPKLDFDLRLPSDSHGSGLLDYVSNWADAFICDKILSQYVLPDHYFSQIDGVSTSHHCNAVVQHQACMYMPKIKLDLSLP